MPDAKMTEGEGILREWDESYEFNSQLARLDGIRVLRLKQRIDAALAAKDAKIERLRGMLRKWQWSDVWRHDDGDVSMHCPCCRAYEEKGHFKDCELAALLKEPTNDHHT